VNDDEAYVRTLAACRDAAAAGDLTTALALATAAVAERPETFEGLFFLGVTLQKLGRMPEAIASYERAIRANATIPEAHHNLARALLTLRRFDEAVDALQRALAIRPAYAEAFDALGYAAAELDALDEAATLFARALALDDRDPAVHVRLGNVLLAQRRFGDAKERFEAALARAPASAEALGGLGVALDRLERTDDAIDVYRRTLAFDPSLATTACNLGKALLQTGELDEARGWFERAIALEPRNGSFYLPLVTAGASDVAPEHVERMIALAADSASLPSAQRTELHFALARVYEHAGRIDEAFAHLVAGNALKRAGLRYDEAQARAYGRALEASFDAAWMERVRGCGDPSARPIFIVGMPRSGSTLVEQLLAAHPAVASAGECGVLGPIVREHWPLSRTPFADAPDRLRAIGQSYVHATAAHARGAARLTDKSLENVQLVPLIAAALPNARIIHIRRDDLDLCFSCFATFFADDHVPFTYDLRELGHYHHDYLRMMQRWRALVPPVAMLEVDYEALVTGFEAQARAIVAFCGLAWNDACLAFHTVRRPVRTASNAQVRRPLYRDAVGRAQPFRAHLAPLIDALAEGCVAERGNADADR
jgi:tetratricopeptide (TPR) repeat protein